jgi:hypothetical protein
MMRMLLIITAVSLTVASGAAHAMAVGAASGFSWNQVAADESARYWAPRVVLSWRLVLLGCSMRSSATVAAS